MDTIPAGLIAIYALCEPNTGVVRYIGRADDPAVRFREHTTACPQKIYAVTRWVLKLRKAGDLPTMRVLDWVSAESWQDAEIWYIARARAAGCALLNLTDGGDGAKGYRHTPESRAKISAGNTGKARTPEYVERLRTLGRGRIVSAETRKKMGDAHRGQVKSDAERAATVARLTGKRRSPETIEKIRHAALNRSPETREKMSASARGRTPSLAAREAASRRHKGVPKSPEHRAAISAARSAWWARRRAEQRAGESSG